jgi:hypothetical protein
MSEPHGFWEQYKENLREYNRQTPWRFLRLVVAFGLTLLLAPCCAAAAAITGEPMAAMVVAVVGIVGVVVAWRVMVWMFDRASNPTQSPGYGPPGYSLPQPGAAFSPAAGQSPFGPLPGGGMPPAGPGINLPFSSQAGFVQPAYAAQLPGQPIMGASTGPVPPFAAEPPRPRSGSGCTIAALTVVGVLLFSCCGGGVALMATLPNFKMQVGPQQPMAGPAGNPFGFPGPFPGAGPGGMPGGMPGAPIQNKDPFEEMRRAQEKGFQDFIKENERQMRELDEQLRKQNERAFPPGF